jgi:hypothetical protein
MKILAENFGGKLWGKILVENLSGKFKWKI